MTDHRTGLPSGSPVVEVRTHTGLVVRVAEPTGPPRSTLYALHGGGLNASYWDCGIDAQLSLARLGTSLGFRVVFPDRPGHRANQERWPDGLPAEDEATVHVETIRAGWNDAPVVLVGHSAGAIVLLHAAALAPWPGLAGVAYSGVGIHLDAQQGANVSSRERFWGPSELYPDSVFDPDQRPTEPTIAEDGKSSRAWGERFGTLAPLVNVPVRITLADHEQWWGDVQEVLATVSAAYSGSPDVETDIEFGAGHNLSVGYAALSYHLGVLAFAERCRRRIEIDSERSGSALEST